MQLRSQSMVTCLERGKTGKEEAILFPLPLAIFFSHLMLLLIIIMITIKTDICRERL